MSPSPPPDGDAMEVDEPEVRGICPVCKQNVTIAHERVFCFATGPMTCNGERHAAGGERSRFCMQQPCCAMYSSKTDTQTCRETHREPPSLSSVAVEESQTSVSLAEYLHQQCRDHLCKAMENVVFKATGPSGQPPLPTPCHTSTLASPSPPNPRHPPPLPLRPLCPLEP
jgi:hypothetical protein